MENYFYKYYSINQNLYNSIINNELYFSNPRNFNDPFDSLPRYLPSENKEKVFKFFIFIKNYFNTLFPNVKKLNDFTEIHSKHKLLYDTYLNTLKQFGEICNVSSNDFDSRIIDIYTFYNDEHYFDEAYSINHVYLQDKLYLDFIYLIIDINKFGISCGSTNPACPVMWGHYGNNHTGICIKYKFSENDRQNFCLDENQNVDVLTVNYSNEPLDIFNTDYEHLQELKYKIFTNKYSKWDYENEVRLIHKQGLLKIDRKCIIEIIFGYKSSHKDRYSLLKLFSSLKYNIQTLSIARILPDKYELKIDTMIMNDINESGVYIKELNLSNDQRKLLDGII